MPKVAGTTLSQPNRNTILRCVALKDKRSPNSTRNPNPNKRKWSELPQKSNGFFLGHLFTEFCVEIDRLVFA